MKRYSKLYATHRIILIIGFICGCSTIVAWSPPIPASGLIKFVSSQDPINKGDMYLDYSELAKQGNFDDKGVYFTNVSGTPSAYLTSNFANGFQARIRPDAQNIGLYADLTKPHLLEIQQPLGVPISLPCGAVESYGAPPKCFASGSSAVIGTGEGRKQTCSKNSITITGGVEHYSPEVCENKFVAEGPFSGPARAFCPNRSGNCTDDYYKRTFPNIIENTKAAPNAVFLDSIINNSNSSFYIGVTDAPLITMPNSSTGSTTIGDNSIIGAIKRDSNKLQDFFLPIVNKYEFLGKDENGNIKNSILNIYSLTIYAQKDQYGNITTTPDFNISANSKRRHMAQPQLSLNLNSTGGIQTIVLIPQTPSSSCQPIIFIGKNIRHDSTPLYAVNYFTNMFTPDNTQCPEVQTTYRKGGDPYSFNDLHPPKTYSPPQTTISYGQSINDLTKAATEDKDDTKRNLIANVTVSPAPNNKVDPGILGGPGLLKTGRIKLTIDTAQNVGLGFATKIETKPGLWWPGTPNGDF